ncbi:hypothetical protein PUNSTDRAFT_52529 [Punctularia strigosozonata HHB-11173 SS5]|uniref:uncharacterized protein n=1 Tax=Punctularia strigosozonata (strain HHB-11173) TaxID=741275 RepID=UPI0004416B1E|nr:uncharacterized protein PUNSTDRAFT_52529 [Punctularia strigosozonata HHB-11173 SS5]EIN09169.1 hypothetical protein PUNSTDRAFT_52529 [Punctularia strigosozonata HHB-11173 SS5]
MAMKSIKVTKDEAENIDLPSVDVSKDEAAIRKAAAAREKDRKEALKTLLSLKRAIAWPVNRWPLERKIADSKTRIHLPRTYLARNGVDTKLVREGTDLNVLVHQHYMEQVDLKTLDHGWVNFVTDEGVTARRHEYLGPDPRVAGYFFDIDGEVHIRWWDAFLQDQWMDGKKWDLDVKEGPDGKWVEKED